MLDKYQRKTILCKILTKWFILVTTNKNLLLINCPNTALWVGTFSRRRNKL